MKLFTFFLTFIFLRSWSFVSAQKNDTLVRPYFFASANFEANITGKVLPSSGMRFGLGINLARFFTKKIVLGLYGETSFDAKFSTNNKFSYLSNDINENIILQQTNPHDSMRVAILLNAFNENRFKEGCLHKAVGLTFSPFPDKYGEMILFLTVGTAKYPFYHKNEFPNDPDQGVYHFIEVPVFFKSTLAFKPLTLTKMKDSNFLKDHLQVGLYLQTISFRHATLDYDLLTNYLNPAFFSGNKKTEYQFGMRIGIGIGFLNRIRI